MWLKYFLQIKISCLIISSTVMNSSKQGKLTHISLSSNKQVFSAGRYANFHLKEKQNLLKCFQHEVLPPQVLNQDCFYLSSNCLTVVMILQYHILKLNKIFMQLVFLSRSTFLWKFISIPYIYLTSSNAWRFRG